MASKDSLDMLFPVGRMIGGNLYTANTTDATGAPLIVKSGPNKGQPRVDYACGIAIPKTPGVGHWANEVSPNPNIGAWGKKLWEFGHSQWPQGQAQRADFSWKIIDGDSAVPNKAGKKPCDQVGYPGHWVLWFGGGFAPKIVNADGSAAIIEPDAVKPGYYVQMFGSISSNRSDQTAGIYLNHRIVALAGFGEEISSGPAPSAVGFGGAPLPAGASAVPLGGMTPPAAGNPPAPPVAPSAPQAAALPQVPVAPAAGSAPAPAAPIPTPAPNMGFVAGPATVPAPPVPVAAPPAPVRQMTAAANGVAYEAYIASGWTDAQLIANGMMLA